MKTERQEDQKKKKVFEITDFVSCASLRAIYLRSEAESAEINYNFAIGPMKYYPEYAAKEGWKHKKKLL